MSPRRQYIDWARGIAVLLMIEAHAIDAWTQPASKASTMYGLGVIFGALWLTAIWLGRRYQVP